MLRRQASYRFQLDDDLVKTDKVRLVALPQWRSSVGNGERLEGHEGYASVSELDRKALLIDGFEKSRAQMPVDLEDGALNGERLLGV